MTTVKIKNSFCDGHQKINISMKPKNHYQKSVSKKKRKKQELQL